MFRFGDRRTRMNWVHVRNLVQAHVLAAEALTAAKGHVAVTTPTPTEGMTGSKNQQGKPPGSVTWENRVEDEI